MKSEARSFVLFFFLTTLDELKAVELASKAMKKYSRAQKKNKQVNSQLIVQICAELWHRSLLPKNRQTMKVITAGKVIFPRKLSLEFWFQAHRLTSESELQTLIWHNILSISTEDISTALSVPEGTIVYRLAHGLRKLGSVVDSEGLQI
jgi:hypothetical protein